MTLITRTYTFTDGTTAYGSQVDSEIANIVNTMNSLDQGNTTWTNVKVTTLLPQADVNMGSHQLTSLGTPTTTGNAAVYPITGSQMVAGTVTGTQIASATITGSNIAAATITAANLSLVAGNITQVLNSTDASGTFSTAAFSTATSQAITTTGGKVLLIASLTVQGTASGSSIQVQAALSKSNTSLVGSNLLSLNSSATGSYIFPMTCIGVDTPTAGTYTYSLVWRITLGNTASVANCSIIAIELKA